MYCKKCGTEQHDGQKFCPKCGEPFLDENGKPYLKGLKKDLQDAKDKLASKADELSQQGKKLVEEKVQPQLNDRIEDFKKVDWEEKKTKTMNTLQSFLSNAEKLRKATIWVAIIAVLWFFVFNHGFSASWTWWLFAIAFVIASFYKVEAKDEADGLNKARWSFGLAVLFGLVLIFHAPSGNSSLGDIDDVDIEASSDQDMETVAEMGRIRGEIKSVLSTVEALYNAHQQHMAQGFPYASSPAWGKWQDCNKRIDDLWNDYIRLAQKLSGNHDAEVEEARESKRKMDKAFMEMFGPHY